MHRTVSILTGVTTRREIKQGGESGEGTDAGSNKWGKVSKPGEKEEAG